MDPQKKIWRGDPGHKYKLRNNKSEYRDSFTPFVFADPCSLETKQNYPGTLIRFPFRNERSELSDKLYTTAKLRSILKALKDDASILLLFLRYIEKIEVFTINTSSFVTKLFSVETDKATERARKTLKDTFFTQVKQYHDHSDLNTLLPTLQYEVTISVHDIEVGTHTNHKWIVANWVGFENKEILEASQRVCSLPWLGLAASLNSQNSSRLFCFLPMPDSEEVNPPLPVCVHGTFGLTKDRRHLKWKTSDMQNDNGALWNDLLLSEMFPFCYAKFLNALRDKCNPNMFYSFWPDVPIINQTNWRVALRPLLSLLLQDQLFWSQNGSWVKLQSFVYVVPQMNSGQFPQVVINALIKRGKVVVVLADRVWEAVRFIHTGAYPFTTITPALVKQALKNNLASYISMSRVEKLQLLHYCLEDRNYYDLPGLVLLPVVNNTFVAFSNSSANKVYTCCTKFLQTRLLANNEAVLVNVEAEDNSLHQKLIQVANSNYTQLKTCKAEDFAMMLKQLLPFQNGWCSYGSTGGFYDENWLKTFWSWVSVHSLSYFIGIPLLPVCNEKDSNSFKIVALQNKSNSRVIKYSKNINFHPELISATGKLGCHLTCSDEFQFLYHSELNNYVHDLTPSSVLNISSQTTYQNVVFTQEEATALRHFLLQYHVRLTTEQRAVVLRLCIFSTIQNNSLHSLQGARCFVAGRSAAMLMSESKCLNKYMFCIPQTPPILACERGYVGSLQSMLPGSSWLPTKLQVILYVILASNQISRQGLLKFFSIILEPSEYHSLIIEPEGSQFIDKLESSRFIPTSQNSVLCLPSETYDPTDLIITGLFEGQNVFPITPFSDVHLTALRELGMKRSNALGAPDIIKITQIICCQSDIHNEMRRANKLLEFLSSYVGSKLLDTYYNRVPFCQTLCSIPWLPVMVDPPKGYPKWLGWKGATGSHFVSAQHLHASSSVDVHRNLPCLIGSQMKILQYEGSYTLSTKLLTSFNISQNVPLDAMIQQFLNLIGHRKDIERSKFTNYITLLYNNLYVAAINNCYSQYWRLLGQSDVVEVGAGKFVQPSIVACLFDEQSMTVGKLEPYLYILPSHLQRYKELYCHIGVKQQVTIDSVLVVLENIASKQNKNDSELAIKILKWLCRTFTETELKHLQDKIFVPVDGNDVKDKLVFKSANDVAFLDKKLQWLKKDRGILNDIMKGYYLVHPMVSNEIASTLQLKPLNTMIANSEEFCFEQAGQSEQLTTRLNRILKQYKDTSVIQELLQNADDAGATEVAVYYDTREHDRSNLFFPGMANSYGPALLFYNNAEFTEEDFVNIRKIAGETKMNKPLKIGKFGIGFCSVYHITDVPSFVSGECFVVFDPTLQCMKEEIESKFNPGIKFNYCKNLFLKASNQLSPYVGIHGFDHKKPFKGTLFRFPLRFKSSQISDSTWTENALLSMITGILKLNAPKLLMFLNNVKKISFHQSHGNSFKKVFSVTASKTDLARISESNLTSYEVKFSPQSDECKEENWIIASNYQQLVLTYNSMQVGTASVSVRLNTDVKTKSHFVDAIKGECFCYLPLHIETGLPVHVSSNFAVTTNRRGLWKADNIKATTESKWNKTLMASVVFQAYTALLLHLKQMQQERELVNYNYWQLWPVQLKETAPWEVLLNTFYNSTLSSDYPLFYSKVGSWKYLNECKFLSSNILSASFEKELQLAIHKVMDILKLPVVDIPDALWNKLATNDNFKSCVINEEQLLNIFYDDSTLSKVPIKYKNIIIKASLIVYANNQHSATLPKLMRSTKCIPCCPDGIKVKKPQDIVDSQSEIAVLFNSKENMCADDNFLKQSNLNLLHQSLVGLGMMQSLPWKMIIDRAKNLQKIVQSHEEKVSYLNVLVSCIKENLSKNSFPLPEDKNALQKIPFLPVMQKPTYYLLNWKGHSIIFSNGPKLTKYVDSFFAINPIYACGSQIFILDTNVISSKFLTREVLDLLGVRKELETSDVFRHFIALTEWFQKFPVEKQDKSINRFTSDVIAQIYAYWGKNIASRQLTAESLSNFIKNKVCIWNGTQFLHPSTIAFKWPTDGPFLYKLPTQVPQSMQPVMKHLGIEDDFSVDVLVDTLCKMKQQYNDMDLPLNSQEIVNLILPKITNNVPDNAEIFLPDEKFVLRRAKELKYNDAPWCTLQEDYLYCHNSVSRETALSVGVEPVRNILLQDFEITEDDLSEDFGQEEKLTQRLNNILRDYPKDITFIKEILQNADDAGATQLYFILDKRYHSDTKVISEAWKQLQGPALLIWNNSTFDKDDFEGIQRLGLGSKKDDANKIGHYGIGFSVVYHFTDCPSFVTDNKLCILDPHYHYIAHKKLKPGRVYKNFNELQKKFPSMKSPYLLNDHGNVAQEIKSKGTLFRLPLRLTQEMVAMSDFTNDTMSLEKLESFLREWISRVSEALLFLQHINDVRFFVINEGQSSRFELCIHEKSNITGEKVVVKKQGNSKLLMYPMTLFSKGNKKTDWLVQLGEGNVEDPEFDWDEVKPPNINIWPQHGIAVPVNVNKFEAKSFCYLPLPGETRLPIHIHGHFILHSDRRGHWVSSSSVKNNARKFNKGSGVCTADSDPKAVWNEKLLKAISVSYAHFLISYRNITPGKKDALQKALSKFYLLFPTLYTCNTEPWLNFVKELYAILAVINAPILAKLIKHDASDINTDHQTFVIRWYELYKPDSPDECFFNNSTGDLYNALTSIGMNLINTPNKIYEQFKKVDENQLYKVSNVSILKYYSQFRNLIYNRNSLPCPLSLTKFKNFDTFIVILNYLMQDDWVTVENESFRSESIIMKDYSALGLVVTADGNLHSLSDSVCIISSVFWNLFPKSQRNFIHVALLKYYPYNSDYLLFNSCNSKEQQLKCISSVVAENLPSSWNRATQVSFEGVKPEWIQTLFKCFVEDHAFWDYYNEILKSFPLLPASNNKIYSASSKLLPLKTILIDDVFIEPVVHDNIENIKKLLTKLKVPLFRHDILSNFEETLEVQLPSVSNAEKILESLYLIKNNVHVFQTLNKDELILLFEILKLISYASSTYQSYIRSLPIFTTINNKLANLIWVSDVWIWDDEEVCTAGMDIWIKYVSSNEIFLNPLAPWACLQHEAKNLQMNSIEKYHVYRELIFPTFHLLDKDAQLCQLRFIRDNIYPECKFLLEGRQANKDVVSKAKMFVDHFTSLKCILNCTGDLCTIDSFYDHSEILFKQFCHENSFLPSEFRTTEWIEFLKYFGLNSIPTKNEFITFCKMLSKYDDVSTVAVASSILLKALFYIHPLNVRENKYREIHSFSCLEEVSEIPIVIVQSVPELNSIKAQKLGDLVVNHCSSAYSLAKLSGSSLVENKYLLWTIKPLIKLDYNHNSSVCRNRLNYLGVILIPSVEDVLSNLKNLSTTAFASSSRFEIEDLNPLYFNSQLLPEVVVAMLKHIQTELLNNQFLSFEEACNQLHDDLSNKEILPVRLHSDDTEQYALAMPTQVLNIKSPSDIDLYYPFLHPLIEKANSVVHFLSNIGVQNTLNFSHIRYILLLAKDRFKNNKIDPETQSVVIEATQDLVKLLQHEQPKEDIAQCLQPLYLLNEYNVLTECSKIIVSDISGSHRFPLPAGYAYLHSLGESHLQTALLHFLPKQFGLISLKSILRYEVVDISPAEDVFPRVSIIEEILKSSAFKEALLLFSNCCTHGTTPDSVTNSLTNFQNNLTVQYLTTVNVKPYLVIDDTVIPISGTLNYSFFLDKNITDQQQQWILSLKNTQNAYPLPVFLQLAKRICSMLKLYSTHARYFDVTDNDDLLDLATFVAFVLQCDSTSSIANAIKQYIPGAQSEEIDPLSNSDAHLFDLLSPEEWIGNVSEQANENISCKQMLQEVARTFMEWSESEPQIDLNEAKIWIQQARYDHSALCTLMDASRTDGQPHFASICFMCHQVAEKSYKAGVYAKSGLKQIGLHTHDLLYLASELEKIGVRTINQCEVAILNNLYLPTRYPNCHNPSAVPGDKFSTEKALAEQAFDAATRIFEAMQKMIDDIH